MRVIVVIMRMMVMVMVIVLMMLVIGRRLTLHSQQQTRVDLAASHGDHCCTGSDLGDQ